jgi:hypothetical protein
MKKKIIHYSLFVLLTLFSATSLAEKNSEPKIDIDFKMLRDAKDAWDIGFRRNGLFYGEKGQIKARQFPSMKLTSTMNYHLQKEGEHREIEIEVCTHIMVYGSQKLETHRKNQTCYLHEVIRFQFKPGEVIEMPSKVEPQSKFQIVVTESA